MGTPAAGPDSPVVGRVAVMSIHPRYANQILAGAKRVEFRKRPLARDVTHVVVYATAPVSAVVGAFTVEGQHTLTPGDLWNRFAEVGGIDSESFDAYYAGRAAGTGITVGQVLAPATPLGLRDRLGLTRPPQSFQYVGMDAAADLLREMTVVGG